MLDYMENSDDFTGLSKEIQENCQNRHELCAFWAAIGECEANVGTSQQKNGFFFANGRSVSHYSYRLPQPS
jgi:hypothetical protein